MTSITSAEVFVHTLRRCGLLEGSQLNALDQALDPDTKDPRPLARRLLHQGWLTPYQVNQVLSGRGRDLVLGSYLVLERLGEGGMGQVFKARHQKLGRTVALKVMRRERLADPEAVRRFRREVQIVSQLAHPNIVLAYDADEVAGTHFLVMEYVEGVSLSEYVKRNGALPVAQACNYVRQTALGLQYAFERDLVHRDIKPSNLLVTKGPPVKSQQQGLEAQVSGSDLGPLGFGLVKILDLGLARLRLASRGEDSSDALTHFGVLMGTPDYIAAEQAANPHEADTRSDLYSLGCTFYCLLTGSVPFPGGSTVEKLFRHQGEEPVPVEERNRSVPPEVAGIVRRLMAKKPADRFQTPGQAVAALTPLVRVDEAAATVPAAHATMTDCHLATTPLPGVAPDGSVPGRPLGDDFDFPEPIVPRTRSTPDVVLVPANRRLLFGSAAVVLLAAISGAGIYVYGRGGADKPEVAVTPPAATAPQTERRYVRGVTWQESVLATLKANGLPTLEGKWHYVGPFNNPRRDGRFQGAKEVFPPEKDGFDPAKTYTGKDNAAIAWKEFGNFRLGQVMDLALFNDVRDAACVYLYHEFDVTAATPLPLSLGGDDTLTVWHNGQLLFSRDSYHGSPVDQERLTLNLKPGKNQLLVKVCNTNGPWEAYAIPMLPPLLERAFGDSLRRDFPGRYPGPR